MIISILQARKQKPGVVKSVHCYEGGKWHYWGWCPDSNALNSRASPVLPSVNLSSPGCPITLFPLLEEEARGKMEIKIGRRRLSRDRSKERAGLCIMELKSGEWRETASLVPIV